MLVDQRPHLSCDPGVPGTVIESALVGGGAGTERPCQRGSDDEGEGFPHAVHVLSLNPVIGRKGKGICSTAAVGHYTLGADQQSGGAMRFTAACLVALAVVGWQTPAAAAADGFDLVIVNGHIIDGTGSPWYSGDVGIRAGRIAAIGNLTASPRRRTIDAHGSVVAPGFIDMLGQSDLTILVDARLPSKIYQGITTEITGEGGSVAPLNAAVIAADRATYDHLKITPDWTTLREYFGRLERHGMGINLASYVGATSVRRMVLGDGDVQPTAAQLSAMQTLVREGMQDGAVGLSTALQYTPAPYAKTQELIDLASEAAKYGGIYATHMRSEGDGETAAIEEAVQIGREAHIPV